MSTLVKAFKKEYVEFCLGVENRDFKSIGDRLSQEKNIRLTHAAIGICTEITELFQALQKTKIDTVNIGEEIGDVLWYVAVASDALNTLPPVPELQKPKRLSRKAALDKLVNLQILSGEFLDKTKKVAFYGKTISDEQMTESLWVVVIALAEFANEVKVDLAVSVEANTKKLAARYQGGFSNDKANKRDLSQERSILESNLNASANPEKTST